MKFTTLSIIAHQAAVYGQLAKDLDAFNTANIARAIESGNKLEIAFAKALTAKINADPDNVPEVIQKRILGEQNALGRSIYCTDDECNVPLTLQGIWGYGCWCHFDNDILKGHGPALNRYDAVCKRMQLCLRCAGHDGPNCNPEDTSTTYNADYNFNVNTQDLSADCSAQNPGNTCGEHMCTCELGLIAGILDALWGGFAYDSSLLHSNGFSFQSNCPATQAGPAVGKSCCGYYDAVPYRQPYVTESLNCCEDDQNTYSDLTHECCPGLGVRTLGNC